MLKVCLGLLLLCISWGISAQQDTIAMYVNGKPVSVSDFQLAYDWAVKNETNGREIILKDFVGQYIDCRLKVSAAEVAGLDTTAAFKYKMDSLRRYLSSVYLGSKQLEDSVARLLYGKIKQRQEKRIRVSHIFKKLPQNVTKVSLQRTEFLMDSIYGELKKNNASFQTYVDRFSDEKDSFWVSRLQTTAEFESVVWNLPVGEISAPFYTPLGIHIVKVLEVQNLSSLPENEGQLVQCDYDRADLRCSMAQLVARMKKEYQFNADKVVVGELFSRGHSKKVLFTLAGIKYDGEDFTRFASAYPGGIKKQFEAFVQKTILDYGYAKLRRESPELRIRMQAYRDTLLCSSIRSREIVARGGVSETGLKNYFESHRMDYAWDKPRYKGIVLHCVNKRVGKRVRKFLKRIPEDEWLDALRLSVNTGSEKLVQADYGTFSLGDNAFVDEKIFHNGKAVSDASFPYVVLLGEKIKGPADYREVLQTLMTDYQHYLEACWVSELRTQSKVEINQEVLKTVNNH